MNLKKTAIKKIAKHSVFILVFLVYIVIKLTNINYSYSDENTYFYMGKLVAEGLLPYNDFFFSHPPLQIYLFSLIFKITGFNFLALKLTPLICTIISALLIYIIVNQKVGYREAVLALLLFLFSYDSLRFSSYAVGVNLTTMFVVIGVYYLVNKKYFLSGIFYGLSAITGLYSLILALTIILVLYFKNKGYFLRFLLGFSIIFLMANLLFTLLASGNYLKGVYQYHLLKPPEDSNKLQVLARLVKVNLVLFGSFFIYLFRKIFLKCQKCHAFLSMPEISKGNFLAYQRFGMLFITVVVYLFFLVSLQSIFGFYSMVIFPFLAVLGSCSLSWFIKKNKIILLILISIITLSTAWSINKYIRYDYQDFNNAKEIAGFIKDNSDVNDTIYGDDSITGLIALLSNRRITANFADSNNFIFKSGVVDMNKTIATLKSEKVKFIIIYKLKTDRYTARFGPAFIDNFYNFVINECKIAKEFKEDWQGYEKIVELYECRF